MRFRIIALLAVAFAVTVRAATPSLAERLDRAERFQDWAAVEKLSRGFVLARRGEIYALTSILDGCVARGCDERALVAGLRGPLVSDGVREFARAWLEYVARDPGAARTRFEALSRDAGTAWLGAFGRLAYATDARNASLLREAIRDARSDPAIASTLAEDVRNAEMTLASLDGDEQRLAALAAEGGDSAGALMARFSRQLAADDFAAADKTMRRYVALWGEDQDLALSRIELARATRPPQEVVAAAKRALQAHPRYWRLRFALSQSHLEAGDEAAAREVLTDGFPVEFASVRLELAVARSGFGTPGVDGEETSVEELRIYRDFPEAQAALASAMLDRARTEEAVELLDRADAMTEALASTLSVRARMAREAERTDEYVQLLERAAARTPHDVNTQLILGLAYVKAGESVKAAGVAAALRRSPRYVRPESIELIEKAARDLEPSFRTA
jgi:predicted Zn-dependent protease